MQARMIEGQGIGAVFHGDEGFYPIAAMVIQRHSQALHFGILLLQGVQELLQLVL